MQCRGCRVFMTPCPEYGKNWDGRSYACRNDWCERNKKELRPLRDISAIHHSEAVERLHRKPRHLWHDEDQKRFS